MAQCTCPLRFPVEGETWAMRAPFGRPCNYTGYQLTQPGNKGGPAPRGVASGAASHLAGMWNSPAALG